MVGRQFFEVSTRNSKNVGDCKAIVSQGRAHLFTPDRGASKYVFRLQMRSVLKDGNIDPFEGEIARKPNSLGPFEKRKAVISGSETHVMTAKSIFPNNNRH